MGYAHYWEIKEPIDEKTFLAASRDCRRVCDAAGVPLTGAESEEPQFTEHDIDFNGVNEDAHEPFLIGSDCRGFNFCKTGMKPYDLCVTCCLIVFKHHYGERIRVNSDGGHEEWKDARKTCQRALSYGTKVRLDGCE